MIKEIKIRIIYESSHYTAEAVIVPKESSLQTKKLMIGNLNYFLENLENYQIEKLVKN